MNFKRLVELASGARTLLLLAVMVGAVALWALDTRYVTWEQMGNVQRQQQYLFLSYRLKEIEVRIANNEDTKSDRVLQAIYQRELEALNE